MFFFERTPKHFFRPTVLQASMERSDGATFGTGPVESGGKWHHKQLPLGPTISSNNNFPPFLVLKHHFPKILVWRFIPPARVKGLKISPWKTKDLNLFFQLADLEVLESFRIIAKLTYGCYELGKTAIEVVGFILFLRNRNLKPQSENARVVPFL